MPRLIPESELFPGCVIDQYGNVVSHGEALPRAARVVVVDHLGNIIDSFAGGSVTMADYSVLYDRDATGNIIYEGKSSPGSATSAAVWQIKKYTYDAQNNISAVKFAGGVSTYLSIWDNRASLTYS